MRLRAITPIVVPNDELARRQIRYDELCPPGVTLHLDNLAAGPDRLESEAQVRLSEELVFEEAMRTDANRYDGIFLDCVLDPALERLEIHSPLPVFGITRLVSSYLASMNLQMAAVARNQAIADELADRIAAAGWRERLEGVVVLDLSLEDIADTARWNEAVVEGLATAGLQVDAVINGCSAVEVRSTDGPAVLDPTALALRLIGAGTGLFGGGSE